MKTIATKTLTGKNLTVEFGWVTRDKNVWLDGHTVVTQKTEFALAASVEGFGEVRFPHLECKATEKMLELKISSRETNTIEGEVKHNGQWHKITIGIDDDLYNTIRAEMTKNDVKVQPRPTKTHPGYCPHCESYCYGDCAANR